MEPLISGDRSPPQRPSFFSLGRSALSGRHLLPCSRVGMALLETGWKQVQVEIRPRVRKMHNSIGNFSRVAGFVWLCRAPSL
jgi:hypothetical protein